MSIAHYHQMCANVIQSLEVVIITAKRKGNILLLIWV